METCHTEEWCPGYAFRMFVYKEFSLVRFSKKKEKYLMNHERFSQRRQPETTDKLLSQEEHLQTGEPNILSTEAKILKVTLSSKSK